MSIKRWFQSRKPLLKGGIIGAAICVLLFLFYILVYFPIIDKVYANDIAVHGGTPGWTTDIPMYTGHLFPLFSHFVVEGMAMPDRLCTVTGEVEQHCGSWIHKDYYTGRNCIPWGSDNPDIAATFEGCCIDLVMTPTAECDERVELLGFFVLVLLLISVYFAIGAVVGWLVGRRKMKR